MYIFIYEAFSKRLAVEFKHARLDEADCKNLRKEKNTKEKRNYTSFRIIEETRYREISFYVRTFY